MKTKLTFLLALTIIFYSTLSVNAAANKYSCNVKDFHTGTDSKTEFIAKNLRKKYLITVDEKKIFMTQISSEYRNAQMIFEIIGRNKLGIYSMEKSSIGFTTLIFHEMSGSASMVVQTFAGVNAWMLECK